MPEKKQLPKFYPERDNAIAEIAEKAFDVIIGEYNISALEFFDIMEYAKKQGLRRFKL